MISLEYTEGYQAYGEGVNGYKATPYGEGTQEMTDWSAGWVAASLDHYLSGPPGTSSNVIWITAC